jgi:hypothetical protein
LRADRRLQFLDLAAERRLGHAQTRCRASEMKFLRDGDQPAQLFQRVRHARKVSTNAIRDLDRHENPVIRS